MRSEPFYVQPSGEKHFYAAPYNGILMIARSGVTPILSLILMVSIILALGGGAVIFLQSTQGDVVDTLNTDDFETVNVTCATDQLTWWIENDGDRDVADPDATLIMVHGERLNRTVPLTLSAGFTRAGGTGPMTHDFSPNLTLGEQYQLSLEFSDVQLTATCRAGGAWYDINWDYRRPLTGIDGADLVNATLNTTALIREGKMRSDCADLRVGQGTGFRDFDITNGECDTGNTNITINTSSTTPQIYVYYGNLQAGSNESSLGGPGPLAELGPEERIRLPQ